MSSHMFGALLTAGQDLFSSDWTEGNLYSIPWLVGWLGKAVGIIISAGGFGIVMVSIAKNVFSGVYLMAPKFWDNVDAIKKSAEDGLNSLGSKNNVAKGMSGIGVALLKLVPNVKDLTDFADDSMGAAAPISAKGYFINATGKLILSVCIGMLIFYGYSTKIAQKAGEGVSYAIDIALERLDPENVVSSFTGKKLLTYQTEDEATAIDKVVHQSAVSAMSIVSSQYNDIENQPQQQAAYTIENFLLDKFSASSIYAIVSSDAYRCTVNTTFYTSVPKISANTFTEAADAPGVYTATATDGSITIKTWIAGTALDTGSTKVGADDYIMFTIIATPIAQTNVSTTRMTVYGSISSTGVSVKTNYKLNTGVAMGSKDGELSGSLGRTVTVTAYLTSGDKLVFSPIIETANASGAGNLILNFTVPKSQTPGDMTDIRNVKDSVDYYEITLSGDWYTSITSGVNTNTYKVNTIMLKPGTLPTKYRLSSSPHYVEGYDTTAVDIGNVESDASVK